MAELVPMLLDGTLQRFLGPGRLGAGLEHVLFCFGLGDLFPSEPGQALIEVPPGPTGC